MRREVFLPLLGWAGIAKTIILGYAGAGVNIKRPTKHTASQSVVGKTGTA